MRRRLPVLLALAVALLAAGCGQFGDGGNARFEESLADSVEAVLSEDAPLVEVRAVTCDGTSPALQCLVSLGVGNTVVQVRYDVNVDAADCWEARAGRIVVLGAGSQTDPLDEVPRASDLKGCAA